MLRAASRRGARHLLERWVQVAGRLRAAKHLALFLDFDGTLVRLRRWPEDVWLDDATRRLLRRLALHPRVTVWVISGRRLADVKKRVNVPGVHYLGLHGWERGKGASHTSATRKLLRRVQRLLARHLGGLPGMWIEDKALSFSVHCRGAPGSAVRRARAIVSELAVPFEPKLRVLRGKKIWEVLPGAVEGKGTTVRALLSKIPGPVLAIYVGDDVTDEEAFAALPQGLTVRVGAHRKTKARFRLRNPEEVKNFLERLEAEIT